MAGLVPAISFVEARAPKRHRHFHEIEGDCGRGDHLVSTDIKSIDSAPRKTNAAAVNCFTLDLGKHT
jgi:hypothetical protein